jgi:Ca2+/Na+ antiporter
MGGSIMTSPLAAWFSGLALLATGQIIGSNMSKIMLIENHCTRNLRRESV